MAKIDNIPTVLAFKKKFVPSDGFLYGTTWTNREQIEALNLKEKSIRGTISNRLKSTVKSNVIKLNSEVEKANLKTIDTCSLKPYQDTLQLQFTLKILGGIAQPSACNNPSFKLNYKNAVKDYVERISFSELANRYAQNIANARFLWRNRIGAQKIEVIVKTSSHDQHDEWVFNAHDHNTKQFDSNHSQLESLANKISQVLSSDDDFIILDIVCNAQIGKSQDVYPSEELVLDKGKGKKSKILYAVDNIAAIHSQKIGNALRTIDTWYSDFSNPNASAGPIAIEPYGAVTNLGKAYRTPVDKQDFFTFFDTWSSGQRLKRLEDEHYVMAVLVRGGVFGQSDR